MSLAAYISMLRGINVSGQKMIRMQELVAMYKTLGFTNVSTFIQSGNVVFSCAKQDIASLTTMIEEQIHNHFGYSVSVFIRTVPEMAHIITTNPFSKQENETNKNIYITFLQTQPVVEEPRNVKITSQSGEEYIRVDREIFLFCPNGYGRTKLNNNYFERKYKLPVTTRNWNTVKELYKLATLI
ncbi:MAG TPA: DUF1697 domain-containing protein [bacterium]|nr:DUF1697 domain-containing protein [bacterium]HPN44751.1 DUF1697 domain-containing protein [bacterium]